MSLLNHELLREINRMWRVLWLLLAGCFFGSGCTYVKGVNYSYKLEDANATQTAHLPDPHLQWLYVSQKTHTLWIPPAAFVGWSTHKFKLSVTLEGELISETAPAFTLNELRLYEDSVLLYASSGDIRFTQQAAYRSRTFETDYFLRLRNPRNRNFSIEIAYTLTSETGATKQYTLQTPLHQKSYAEVTFLTASVWHKSK